MEITPSKSVIEGRNGTVSGLKALAASLERTQQIELYSQYGHHVFESMEDFVDRMRENHGSDWIDKFIRK